MLQKLVWNYHHLSYSLLSDKSCSNRAHAQRGMAITDSMQAAMNTFTKMSFLLLLLLATQTVASYPWPENVTQHSGYITVSL